MRRRAGIAVVLAAVALAGVTALASASGLARRPAPGAVRLLVATHHARAGDPLPVVIVDPATWVEYDTCFVLQRRVARGWRTVTRGDGLPVMPCPRRGTPQMPRLRLHTGVDLYHHLPAGTYRAVLSYRPSTAGFATGHGYGRWHTVTVTLEVIGALDHLPHPRLPEARILHIALRAAAAGGDAHPSLVQHAAGTRYDAVFVASEGDTVESDNWSYAIAIRGHFSFTVSGPAGGRTSTARIIRLVVDAATGQVTDSGSVNRWPDLRRLGPVTTDLRR